MSATYSIYTSPTHAPDPTIRPTLIVTPHGKPSHILYSYLHTNFNQEQYLLTPSDQGDLCVAKLYPPNPRGPNDKASSSGHGHGGGYNDRHAVRCEASRNLRWTIRNEGIQNPVYKLTLPNPENAQVEQPLFQVSKPNPNSPWWTLFYFTYAGHLIPPKRIEFGRIMRSQPGEKGSGGTKISVTGKSEEEKAVWKTLGEGNEDMVEWIIVCAALNVLDDEIAKAAEAAGVVPHARPPPSTSASRNAPRQLHPTGSTQRPQQQGAPQIRPAIYNPRTASPMAPSRDNGHLRNRPGDRTCDSNPLLPNDNSHSQGRIPTLNPQTAANNTTAVNHPDPNTANHASSFSPWTTTISTRYIRPISVL